MNVALVNEGEASTSTWRARNCSTALFGAVSNAGPQTNAHSNEKKNARYETPRTDGAEDELRT
jgi:hypothetical protein